MTTPIHIWSDSFSVGHALLDAQHRRMLGLCRQIEDTALLHGPEALSVTHILLLELQQSSQEHFKTEYRILHSIGYPHLQDEIAEHIEFQNMLSRLLYQLKHARSDDAAMRRLLSEWTLEHLFDRDMKYKPFLSARPPFDAGAAGSGLHPAAGASPESVSPGATGRAILT